MAEVTDKYRGNKEYALAYAALVMTARSRAMITYRGIARLTGLPDEGQQMGKEVGHLLGEISEDEHSRGRPMLSAIAVQKATGRPGGEFYEFAGRLNKLKGDAPQSFWDTEVTKLYDFWDS